MVCSVFLTLNNSTGMDCQFMNVPIFGTQSLELKSFHTHSNTKPSHLSELFMFCSIEIRVTSSFNLLDFWRVIMLNLLDTINSGSGHYPNIIYYWSE